MSLLIFNLKTDAKDDVLGFTTAWVNSLAQHFEHVVVITMCSGLIEVANNVEVYSVGQEKGSSKLRRLVNFYGILIKVLRTHKIDVCFAHMIPVFAILAWPVTSFFRIPMLMWYAHGSVPISLRLAARLVDGVVSSSESGFRIITSKLSVLGQGVDVKKFSPSHTLKPMRFEILTVGRISFIKRLEILIEALPKLPLSVEGRKTCLHFVGSPLTDKDHQYFKSLQGLVARLGLQDRVVFTPSKPYAEIHHTFRQADIFVNSSDTGSMDKTVLEAMSCGLPVITTNIAFSGQLDSPSYLKDRDSNSLAKRLKLLMSLPEGSRRSLGLSLRDIVVENHSLDKLTKKIVFHLLALKKQKP